MLFTRSAICLVQLLLSASYVKCTDMAMHLGPVATGTTAATHSQHASHDAQ